MYAIRVEELPSKSETILDSPLLFYVYLFQRNSGEDVVKNTLGNNWIPSTIPGWIQCTWMCARFTSKRFALRHYM
jgi:hypothetical protein